LWNAFLPKQPHRRRRASRVSQIIDAVYIDDDSPFSSRRVHALTDAANLSIYPRSDSRVTRAAEYVQAFLNARHFAGSARQRVLRGRRRSGRSYLRRGSRTLLRWHLAKQQRIF